MWIEKYEERFEVSGTMACFTRPDSGATPVSYPVPTFNALKQMFANVAILKSCYIIPTRLEVCCDIEFMSFSDTYNSGIANEASRFKEDLNGKKWMETFMRTSQVLVNVCYRVYGKPCKVRDPYSEEVKEHQRKDLIKVNHLHHLHAWFERNLKNGKFRHMPFLGLKDCLPSYFGPFRDGTKVNTSINMKIPGMLKSPFIHDTNFQKASVIDPRYRDYEIVNGVLEFKEDIMKVLS